MMFTCRENEMKRNAGIVSSIPEGDLQSGQPSSFLCKTEISEFFTVLGCCTMYVSNCWTMFWNTLSIGPKGGAVLGL